MSQNAKKSQTIPLGANWSITLIVDTLWELNIAIGNKHLRMFVGEPSNSMTMASIDMLDHQSDPVTNFPYVISFLAYLDIVIFSHVLFLLIVNLVELTW